MATSSGNGNGTSIGELLRQLIEDTGHLFRTELRLFQAEVQGNLAALKGGVLALAIGGTFLLVATFTLVGAFVGWLTPYVGAGWAAFIVAVAFAVLGIISMAVGGAKLRAASLSPDRTVASLRADAETLKGN